MSNLYYTQKNHNTELHFRSPLWSALWLYSPWLILNWSFFIPVLLFRFERTRTSLPSALVSLALIMISMLGILVAISWVCVCASKITVKTSGIRGYKAWGDYSFVAWDEMDTVKPYNLMGLRYLRLFFRHSSSPLWIPLFLVRYDEFKAAVIERAPESNPLRCALERKIGNSDALFTNEAKRGNKNWEILPPNLATTVSTYLQNHKKTSQPSTTPPWMQAEAFGSPPIPATYGYYIGETWHSCSPLSLVENIRCDTNKQITLVGTPETTNLTPPEEISFLFEAVRLRERTYLKKMRFFYIYNSLLWGFLVLVNLKSQIAAQVMLFNFIILGLLPLVEHSVGLYRLQLLTPAKMSKRIFEARYLMWVRQAKAPWTWALVGCITIVGAIQLLVGIQTHKSSIAAAGIVKQAIWQGEVWRLITGTLLHGNVLHFLFNITALFVLGKLLEALAHRVYVPLVFLLSALSGSLFSLVLLPDTTSVGASGGIMGMIGFLIILAWRHKRFFPPSFLRLLLVSVVYTAAVGVVAYRIIDNPAHLGGLLMGILLGVLLIPRQQKTIPLKGDRALEVTGILAGALPILFFTILCLVKMLGN